MTNEMSTEIESLRTFALAHSEVEFAHLCTSALHQSDETWGIARSDAAQVTGHIIGCDCTECSLIREESVFARDSWAVERVAIVISEVNHTTKAYRDEVKLSFIRATDTTRPDGAVARSFTL